MLLSLPPAPPSGPPPLPPSPPAIVVVDRDNVEIFSSCTIRFAEHPIADRDDDGVVHVVGDDLDIRFDPLTPLRGAPADAAPDTFTGIGVRATGRDVSLSGLRVRGFKVGLLATAADGLTVRDCDVSGNFRQRLRSSPRAEDIGDWLSPHANDRQEWRRNYGAGLCVEDSSGVTIRGVRARDVQNGIILDRVLDSRVFDNDCSFLSGWGLAMWRSSRNLVSRNAFDFCVRGYSHGVYNRGQDAAGILLFEQCSDNVFVDNSATHGGDGVFGFAGREALGEASPRDDLAWYERRGCNDNRFFRNDFSYAAAHGLELTFSFGNVITDNRFFGNAICGIWAGYAQGTAIVGNLVDGNGDAGYGLERGGVNIEHGTGNEIALNAFRGNACGVHFWWDPDEALMRLPWARANHRRDLVNFVQNNTFEDDVVAIQLRATHGLTSISNNQMSGVGTAIDADDDSPVSRDERGPPGRRASLRPPAAIGDTRPFLDRSHPGGRARIVMTEWGPYDWTAPLLVHDGLDVDAGGRPALAFRLIGNADARLLTGPTSPLAVVGDGIDIHIIPDPPRNDGGVLATVSITARRPGVHPVTVRYTGADGAVQEQHGVLSALDWTIRHFASPVDPRDDPARWRAAAAAPGARVTHAPRLEQRYANGGPAGGLPTDHFGTIATTRVRVPAGRWRLRTTSDDGLRVWLDDTLVIDDWTHHAPTPHDHAFTLDEPREIALRVEHFELDGYAILSVGIEHAEP